MGLNSKLSIPPSLQNARYPVLDGLRGLAILLVLLPHFGINYYLRGAGVIIDSSVGVHIFFVISGFLITTLLHKEKLASGTINLRYFYMRRALRILPVAYLFLVVLIALNVIFNLQITTRDFLESFTFLKNLPGPSSYYTAHYWSLAVEEQYYLVFPLLLMLLNPNRYMVLILAVVIAVPLLAIVSFYNTTLFDNHTAVALLAKFCRYAFWKGPTMILIGAAFALLLFKRDIKIDQSGMGYYISFLLLVLAIIISMPRFMYYYKYIAEYISAILFGLVIIMSVNSKSFLSTVLSSKIMARIGVLSYSLYIWQQLFVGIRAWQPWMHFLRPCPVWVLIILKLLMVFLIASLSFKFEKRFLILKEKYRPQRTV